MAATEGTAKKREKSMEPVMWWNTLSEISILWANVPTDYVPQTNPFICHVFVFEKVEIQIPIPQHSACYVPHLRIKWKFQERKKEKKVRAGLDQLHHTAGGEFLNFRRPVWEAAFKTSSRMSMFTRSKLISSAALAQLSVCHHIFGWDLNCPT